MRIENALPTFQIVIEVILATFMSTYTFAYFEDVVQFSKEPQGYIQYIKLVLRLLKEVEVILILNTFASFTDSVEHLG